MKSLESYLPPIEGKCGKCGGKLVYEYDEEIHVYDLKCMYCGKYVNCVSVYALKKLRGDLQDRSCRTCVRWHEYIDDQCSVNRLPTPAIFVCSKYSGDE